MCVRACLSVCLTPSRLACRLLHPGILLLARLDCCWFFQVRGRGEGQGRSSDPHSLRPHAASLGWCVYGADSTLVGLFCKLFSNPAAGTTIPAPPPHRLALTGGRASRWLSLLRSQLQVPRSWLSGSDLPPGGARGQASGAPGVWSVHLSLGGRRPALLPIDLGVSASGAANCLHFALRTAVGQQICHAFHFKRSDFLRYNVYKVNFTHFNVYKHLPTPQSR